MFCNAVAHKFQLKVSTCNSGLRCMSIKFSANEISTCVPANQREAVDIDDKFCAFTFFNRRSGRPCLFFSHKCRKKKTEDAEVVDFYHVLKPC